MLRSLKRQSHRFLFFKWQNVRNKHFWNPWKLLIISGKSTEHRQKPKQKTLLATITIISKNQNFLKGTIYHKRHEQDIDSRERTVLWKRLISLKSAAHGLIFLSCHCQVDVPSGPLSWNLLSWGWQEIHRGGRGLGSQSPTCVSQALLSLLWLARGPLSVWTSGALLARTVKSGRSLGASVAVFVEPKWRLSHVLEVTSVHPFCSHSLPGLTPQQFPT